MTNKKLLLALGVSGLALCGLSSNAQAAVYAYSNFSCSNTVYGTSGSYGTDTECQSGRTEIQNSTVATSVTVLQAAASKTAGMIASRLGASAGGVSATETGFTAATGGASGDMGGRLGVWVAGSWENPEDNNRSTAFDGTVWSGLAGVDYKVTDRVTLGLSGGYESLDIDTQYNGYIGRKGNIQADGWTVAPYIGVDVTDKVKARLSAGYSDVSYDTLRLDPNVGNRITGGTDATRYFVNAGLGGTHYFNDRLSLASDLGAFYINEDRARFTETEHTTAGAFVQRYTVRGENTHLGQANLDFRLGYQVRMVKPYVLAGVAYDFAKSDTPVGAGQTESGLQDDFAAKFGGGLSFEFSPRFSGGVEAYTEQFRSDYNNYAGTANLRLKF